MSWIRQRPGLYIHIPFCLNKCRYCNFFSTTQLNNIPDFLAALYKEATFRRDIFEKFDTLYIGGGTPSLLTFDQLDCLLKQLSQNFKICEQAEITIEVNPADINENVLENIKLLGINRLSIGVQAFDDKILKFLGRRHNSSQAINAIHAAHHAGFENFGIDLIYGIPGQNLTDWGKTLQQATSMNIPHLSCYQLTVEANTPLGSEYRQGSLELPDNDELFDWFMHTSIFLEKSGYYHYEVSNFARGESTISRHNSKYWQHVPYLGLGPAAHSFNGGKRWWNVRSLEDYLGRLNADQLPEENCEELTLEDLKLESLFLGFRTKSGIKLTEFEEDFGCDLLSMENRQLEPLLQAGYLKIVNGSLKPTRKGMAIADSLALL